MSEATVITQRKRRLPRAAIAAVVYLVVVVLVVLFTLRLGDVHWLATAMLFGPRWPYALPLPAVLLLARFAQGPARIVVLGAAFVAAVLLLGFNDFHLALGGGNGASPPMRVLSYNIGGGKMDSRELAELVVESKVDVAGFEECGDLEEGPFVAKGYKVRREPNSLCLVTRLPILVEDIRDSHWAPGVNAAGHVSRYELEHAGQRFSVVLVHLYTVRDGLAALRPGILRPGWRGPEEMDRNIAQRRAEAEIAKEWSRRGGKPVIVMGDFNVPTDSAVYRDVWSGFHNALDERGTGHLVTKRTRWHSVRIDHVLFDDAFACTQAWIGRDLRLDHRPVLADLAWSGRK